MSGYFGFVRLDSRPVEDGLLERIAGQLKSPGPDGVSIWKNDRCGGCLASMHTISTPQAEQQPVALAGRYFLWGRPTCRPSCHLE